MNQSPKFKQFSSQSIASKRSFKNYRHPRAKRTVERNSVFSLIADYIEKKRPSRSKSSHLKSPFIDEGLYFQIFGMCILTVAIVLTFQSFVSSDSLSISAQQDQNQKVRLLTNFQYQPSSETNQSRLQDFSIAPVVSPDSTVASTPVPNESAAEQAYVPVTHVVAEGDNVYTIAADYDISPQELIQRNSLIEPYTIKVGDELVIE